MLFSSHLIKYSLQLLKDNDTILIKNQTLYFMPLDLLNDFFMSSLL